MTNPRGSDVRAVGYRNVLIGSETLLHFFCTWHQIAAGPFRFVLISVIETADVAIVFPRFYVHIYCRSHGFCMVVKCQAEDCHACQKISSWARYWYFLINIGPLLP